MNASAFLASRQLFSLKTDATKIQQLRHDLVVRNGRFHRFSLVTHPDYSMYLEAQIVDKAIDHGVHAIPLLTQDDGRHTYQVMRRARGVSVAELPIELKRVAWNDLAEQLRKLHEIKGDGAGLIVATEPLTGAFDKWTDYVQSQLSYHSLYALDNELITEARFAAIEGAICGEKVYENCEMSLLHGDLNDYNLFADPNTGHLTDIIDWEDAMIGDPIFELASWACFTSHAEEKWEAFIWHYYRETQLPQDFYQRFYLYFLRISLSRLVQLSRYGFKDLTRAQKRIEVALERLKSL